MAALDLGSNTFLLLIADLDGQNIKKVLLDETRVTRLGQGVHQAREFHPEALARADATLSEFAKAIAEHKCDKVVAVATSAARDVKNGIRLIEIGQRHGIPIQIISGQQEAEITYDGATADFPADTAASVIDVGGGSTEVIGRWGDRLQGCSVDVGSVRLTEMFLAQHPCRAEDMQRMQNYINQRIAEKKSLLPSGLKNVIAVAGTPTTLAMLEQETEFDEARIHKFEMTNKKIWQWRDRLACLSVEQRQKLPGMQPKRADVLVAGATILASVVEALGAKGVIVSTKGVRYGVARSWQKI
ncbi:MAG: Ppx/GppA family phosphatase [Bdellovibrionales bacterium]